MNCPKCGNELKPNMKFCAKCGTSVQQPVAPVEQPAAPAQPKPVAPAPSKETAQPAQKAEPQKPEKQKKAKKKSGKKNVALRIIAIILVLAVLATGGIFITDAILFKSESEKEGYITDFPVLKQDTEFLVYDAEKFPYENYNIKVDRFKTGKVFKSSTFSGFENVINEKSDNPIYNLHLDDGKYQITIENIISERTQAPSTTTTAPTTPTTPTTPSNTQTTTTTAKTEEPVVITIIVIVDNDDEDAVDKVTINSKKGDKPVVLSVHTTTNEHNKSNINNEIVNGTTGVTEADLKKAIEERSTEEIVYFVADDFNKDGKKEAFALEGKPSTWRGEVNGATENCVVWFVNENLIPEIIMTPNEFWTPSVFPRVDETKGYKFLVLECNGGGSSSKSYIWSVKNHGAYECDISGDYMNFEIKDGKVSADKEDWSEGYHNYIETFFKFDEKKLEFIKIESENGSPNSNSNDKNVKVGDYITFGKYEQDNNTSNGAEDIEWLVLDVKDGKALVISKYALDAKPYNEEDIDVTWETCTLRKWLNNGFINTAFTNAEKAKIPTVTVSADKNPIYDYNPGNATQDKAFLLNITEVDKYFSSDEESKCAPTDYAKAQGVHTSSSYSVGGKATCHWWLRSPVGSSYYVCSADGLWGSGGVCDTCEGVRPAMWINIG